MDSNKSSLEKISRFETATGNSFDVEFVESEEPFEGVHCDTYRFKHTIDMDLALIHILPGHSTPRQRVLTGELTTEGYISGNGKLIVERHNGEKEEYEVDQGCELEVVVNIGDIMQWIASENSELVVYEICLPPYADGRYENL